MTDFKVEWERSVYEGHITVKQKVLSYGNELFMRECIDLPNAVGIVVVFDNHLVYLVNQYRAPIEGHLWEIPAGHIDENEDSKECAIRELYEETGITATVEDLNWLCFYHASVGHTNHGLYLYYVNLPMSAYHERDKGNRIGAEENEMTSDVFTFDTILAKIDNGHIHDSKTIIGCLQTYMRLHVPRAA